MPAHVARLEKPRVEIRNNLSELRSRRGLSATQLAATIGVSRQTVYAIEAGTYVPNTTVSLKLARLLEVTVEELFHIEQDELKPLDETIEAVVLSGDEPMSEGQPLRLCMVNGQAVAVPPEDGGCGLAPSDGVLLESVRGRKQSASARVQCFSENWKDSDRILIAGCDPGASILAMALQRLGCELLVAYKSSSRALELLREGLVHVAGTHLVDKVTGQTDLLPITKMFPRNSVAVISYAIWQEGLVVALGNPKRLFGVADLARKDVRITNCEPGAGCRRLLDGLLHKHGIATSQVNGYDRVTQGHLPAARLVQSGEVDCCVSTQAGARALGLDFVPLAEKPYHLVLRRKHLTLPPVQKLIETLERSQFRREVEASVGYDMRTAGIRLM